MRFLSALLLFLLLHPVAVQAGPMPMEVFVSIAPQQFVVDRIGGPFVKSHLLVDGGQDPHSFEPTPRRLMELAGARLYCTIGLEFERELTSRLGKSFSGLRFAPMDKGIEKLPMEVEGKPGERDEHREAHQEDKDPHIWLSPPLLMKIAENTAEILAGEDPAHGPEFHSRLAALQQELAAIDGRLTRVLLPYKGRAFYVFHPSFGYFAAAYGLVQRAVEAGGRSPSPRQLAALIERARREDVRIIFVQPQFDRKGAEAIARAIDGVVINLDALAYDIPGNFIRIAENLDRALR